MNHSFNKLENFLSSKGFFPQNIFTIDSYCVYIEIFNIYNAETILLYIPSKFNIKAERGNIFKINYIDMEQDDNIVTKYTDEKSNKEIKENYEEISLDNNTNINGNIEDNLNENYNKNIELKNINSNDKSILKDIFRQLTRFKQLTHNIKYKTSILYKNYLCSIKKDETIECYYISNYLLNKNFRKLYITIDLKTFYEKIDILLDDIKVLKNSMYKILNQNQIKHSKLLHDMLQNKDKLLQYSGMISKKKEYYETYIGELESMLKKLNENELEMNKERLLLNNKNDHGVKGMHSDIEKSHVLYKIDEKLEKLVDLRHELTEDIIKTRNEQEILVIEIDKILYDNSVMLNEIIKNFDSICSIIE